MEETVIGANKLFKGHKPKFTWVKEIFIRADCPDGLDDLACQKQGEASFTPRTFHYQKWIYFEECPECDATHFELLRGVRAAIKGLSKDIWGIQCPKCRALMDFYEGDEIPIIERPRKPYEKKGKYSKKRKKGENIVSTTGSNLSS